MRKNQIIQILFIAVLFAVLAIPCEAGMVIQKFTSASYSGPTYTSGTEADNTEGYASSSTVSFTPDSPGTNSIALVVACWGDNRGIISITYDGNACTEITGIAYSNRKLYMWYYDGTLGSGAKNVVLTLSSSTSILMKVIQIDDADGSDPIDSYDTDHPGALDPQETTLTTSTSESNCLIVSAAMAYDRTDTHEVCDTTGQTILTSLDNGSSPMMLDVGYYEFAGSGSVDQCWYYPVANEDQLGILTAVAP